MPQRCYDNVTYLVKLLGGEPVYGWALADSGPLSDRNQQLPPLYGRWINHVVWRDGGGKLWEVTPRFEVGNLARTAWSPTTFAVDSEASFVLDENASLARPSRYVALRSAGEPVAELLNRAEQADSEPERTRLLVMALAEIASRGFTPKECRVETIGTRTNNIWLIAE